MTELRAEFERIQAAAADWHAPDLAALGQFARKAAAAGYANLIVELLKPLCITFPHSADICEMLALAQRDEQDMESALSSIDKAHTSAPGDVRKSALRAQIHFETGRPASALFREALQQEPGNLSILRSLAVALSAEDAADEAIAMLDEALAQSPGWIEGHRQFATFRATQSGASNFAESFARACVAEPLNKPLRLAWFHTLSQARQWEAARQVVEDGMRLFGEQPAFTVARIFIESESGAAAHDAGLFDQVANLRDPGLDLCHIRYALRGGRYDEAGAIADRNLGTASEHMFWPYASLIWRLMGNGKAKWLDGDPLFIRHFDLDISEDERAQLAATLRKLHTLHAPYLDQSVRGGTQTERPLFLRHDPEIQKIRAHVTGAVRDYVSTLPAPVPDHPLLAPRRDKILFEGSWSVLLKSQGHHACHTHPMGWISSALYVDLPMTEQMGAAPSGWLQFGTPPPELGLPLEPYQAIEPKPGRLVLFPSTMWHSTVPFADGERLTIAFDVKRRAA
jgi:Tfp pilus assembly protein PilF